VGTVAGVGGFGGRDLAGTSAAGSDGVDRAGAGEQPDGVVVIRFVRAGRHRRTEADFQPDAGGRVADQVRGSALDGVVAREAGDEPMAVTTVEAVRDTAKDDADWGRAGEGIRGGGINGSAEAVYAVVGD